MLSIRCTVIETGVLGGGLKLDEKTCLQYLSDLHQFLYNNRKQTEDQNCFGLDNNALSITRQEWYDFGSQSTKPISSVLNTLLNESEIEALWSLFATIVIVEGFIYVSKTQTVMNRFHGIQNEIEPSASTPLCNNPSDQNFSNEDKMIDPYIISIDFRYFGLLLFLQVGWKYHTSVKPKSYPDFCFSSRQKKLLVQVAINFIIAFFVRQTMKLFIQTQLLLRLPINMQLRSRGENLLI